MRWIKRALAAALSVLLVLPAGCGSRDGSAEAEVQGYNGPVRVSVTASGGTITGVTLLSHRETEEVARQAMEQVISDILQSQSLAVDTVSGATESCGALLAGVKECLLELGFQEERLYAAAEPLREEPEERVERYDVVVVGSGGAGLAAAITAAQAGARVAVLEKMSDVGGNTVRSTALYNCVDDALQNPLGIYDSEELFFQETYEGGHRQPKEELVRILTSQADEGLQFLKDLGLRFDTVIDNCLGGAHDRGHYSAEHSGTDYVQVMQRACGALGVDFFLETAAREFLTLDGAVTGVRAVREGWDVDFLAGRGVVLATGGFGCNVEMRMRYDQTLTGDMLCSNAPGATGDGLVMAQAVGANLIGMEYIELYPLGDIYDGGLRNSIPNAINNGIFVNSRGARFIREDAGRDDLSKAILAQPGSLTYTVLDDDFSLYKEDRDYLDGLVLMGLVVKADTLPELAEALGFDRELFLGAVSRYNEGVRRGNDADFGRRVLLNEIDRPPFYATARKPTVHYTLGGVEIDGQARVLNTQGGVIPNLFAAGEVTGGIHGANRLGGNAFPDIIVFGRIAGAGAAAGG